jgi:hypothetical protein
MRIYIGFIIYLLILSMQIECTYKIKNMKDEAKVATFSKELVARKFGEFFIYPMHNETIDAIWKDSYNHKLIDKILLDSTNNVTVEAKFLACEIFFKKDIFFMQRHAPEEIAGIYTQALVNNYTGMANSWGLLYEHKDDGTVGIAFLTIGEKSIPSLVKLLDNENTTLTYQGSIEAVTGNSYGYRIKDFAAYYIGRIMGKPLKYYPKLDDRDKQIVNLKKEIKLYLNKK